MLAERKPQHLSRKRAEGANEETIQGFFERVEKLLREAGLVYSSNLADRLWNCDESGLCNAVTTGRILAKKGSRWVHDTAGGSGRSYTTVTLQFMGVVQHRVFCYHPSLFTRGSIFTVRGQRVVQLEPYMP